MEFLAFIAVCALLGGGIYWYARSRKKRLQPLDAPKNPLDDI